MPFIASAIAAVWLAAGVTIAPAPAGAQMLGPTMSQIAGPFAGRMGPLGPNALPPYGAQAGAVPHIMQGTQALMPATGNLLNQPTMARSSEAATPAMPGQDNKGGGKSEKGSSDAPDTGEISANFLELLVGACAGGAFIGAFAAVNATAPVAAVGVAAPAAATAVLSAMGVGCVLGAATATASLGAVLGYRSVAD